MNYISNLIDLSGQRFGRLTVVARDSDAIISGKKRVMWLCTCDCGNTVSVLSDNLKRGNTQSCGCLFREFVSDNNSTHHKSKTKLYGVWCSMKSRCFNKNSNAYAYYGGRGITVCDEWTNDYTVFETWAERNGYSEGLTIDRIDVNGDYCPSNCKWVTRVAQANNRRSNIVYTLNGETHNVTEWSRIYNIDYKKVFYRLNAGWSLEKALTT